MSRSDRDPYHFALDWCDRVYGGRDVSSILSQFGRPAGPDPGPLADGAAAVFGLAEHLASGFVKLGRVEEGLYYSFTDATFHAAYSAPAVGTALTRFRVVISGGYRETFSEDALDRHPHGGVVQLRPGAAERISVEAKPHIRALTLFVDPLRVLGPEASARLGALLERRTAGAWFQPLAHRLRRAALDLAYPPYDGSLGRVYGSAKAREVICMLAAGLQDAEATPSGAAGRTADRVRVAQNVMAATYAEPLTTRALAERVGINRNALMSAFKARTGETLAQHYLRLRMERAQALLLDGDLSVGDIADAVGYRHGSSFTTAFRRCFGVSPRRSRD